MKRVPENNGEYVEINADELHERVQHAKDSQVLVVKQSRIELAGREKTEFIEKFLRTSECVRRQNADMNDVQISRATFRKMMIEL